MIGLHVSTIGVIGNVVQAKDQAIVYIAHANERLIEFLCNKVVACRSHQDPVGIKLDLTRSQDALSAIEKAKLRLGGVISIQQSCRPSIETDAALKIGRAHV